MVVGVFQLARQLMHARENRRGAIHRLSKTAPSCSVGRQMSAQCSLECGGQKQISAGETISARTSLVDCAAFISTRHLEEVLAWAQASDLALRWYRKRLVPC